MNAKLVREYFIIQYSKKYKKNYLSKCAMAEIAMIDRLLSRYGEPLVLYAIDNFIETIPQLRTTINYFSTDVVFNSRFANLIKLQKILIYKRRLQKYPKELYDEVKALIDEYEDYTLAIFPTQSELERKPEIERRLKELDAKGFGSQVSQPIT